MAVFSSGRADYGLLYWTLEALHRSADFEPQLIIAGMHLSGVHGSSIERLESEPWPIAARIDCLLAGDSPGSAVRSLGLATLQLAQELERLRPDFLLLLGDRYELLAAASTALLLRIPIVHLHGGETTLGALDEQVRHSVTQMASLHLPAAESYARNLEAMGEEPWRIHVVGAPGLEWLRRGRLPAREQLEATLGIDLGRPWLLVTYHPVSLDFQDVREQADLLLAELVDTGQPMLFSLPNADSGGMVIRSALQQFVAAAPGDRRLLEGLDHAGYLGLLRHVRAMVGNSSSGLIESPSFELPAVNLGRRQEGRVRAANVLDAPLERGAVAQAVARAMAPEFRRALAGQSNPYGQGDTSRRVLQVLREAGPVERLLVKRRRLAPR